MCKGNSGFGNTVSGYDRHSVYSICSGGELNMCKENCDKCIEDKSCCNGMYRPLENGKRLITYRVWYFDRHMCSKFTNVTASDEYVARKIFMQYHPGCIVRRLYISKYQKDYGGVSNA